MADEITKTDSQIIHEARVDEAGKPLCWHKRTCDECLGCGAVLFKPDGKSKSGVARFKVIANPDYSTNHAEYLKALNEFKKEGWWKEVAYDTRATDWRFSYPRFNEDLFDPIIGSKLIADYLRRRK